MSIPGNRLGLGPAHFLDRAKDGRGIHFTFYMFLLHGFLTCFHLLHEQV